MAKIKDLKPSKGASSSSTPPQSRDLTSVEACFMDKSSETVNLSNRGLTNNDLFEVADFLAGYVAQQSGALAFTCLNLSGNHLCEKSTPPLGRILLQLPALASLDLSNNKYKGERAATNLISAIAWCTSLRHLSLGGNLLGSKGLAAIADTFQKSETLTSLDLGWKVVSKTDKGQLKMGSPVVKRGAVDLAPTQWMQLASRHVMISPDQRVARKMTGGDGFNSNIQWESDAPAPDGSLSYTYRLHSDTHWLAVGWAPTCIELDRKQYHKHGCYLTSTGFPCGPSGTPSILEVEERGKAKLLRTTYHPVNRSITYHAIDSSGRPCLLLGSFNDIHPDLLLLPTICFGHQGGQLTLEGPSRFLVASKRRLPSDSSPSPSRAESDPSSSSASSE